MNKVPERIYLDSDCVEWVRDLHGGDDAYMLVDDGVVGTTRMLPGDVEYVRGDAKLEWQPIETAPKDGTIILAWANLRGMAVSSIFERDDGLMISFGGLTAHESILRNPPTHWMPLPPSPHGEAEQEERETRNKTMTTEREKFERDCGPPSADWVKWCEDAQKYVSIATRETSVEWDWAWESWKARAELAAEEKRELESENERLKRRIENLRKSCVRLRHENEQLVLVYAQTNIKLGKLQRQFCDFSSPEPVNKHGLDGSLSGLRICFAKAVDAIANKEDNDE